MRVCDKDTGKAIWVTKKSATEIEGKAGGEAGGGGGVYEAKIRIMQEEKKKLEEEKKKLEEENTKLRKNNGQGHNMGGIQSQSTEGMGVKRTRSVNEKTGDGEESIGSAAMLRQTVSAERDAEAWTSRDDGLIRKMEEMIQRQLGNVDEKIGKEMQRQLCNVDEKIGKVDDKMNEVMGAVKTAKLKKKGMFF
ncbi:hypothetical protein TrCOL_g10865 [Triparma columacea]|uniref:Uncharacterized protein n=1 Tax=Triparma columacea TaxID=722753 RepID=A0A9W7FX42_9STRA|nr:hypothetical protein TrCOL_g10865 [Triparma columacea]